MLAAEADDVGSLSMKTALRRVAARALGPPTLEESLVARRLLRGQAGVMVDVGAHLGGSLEGFAADGWEIHAFEPDPHNRAALTDKARDWPHVHVNAEAVSTVDGEELPFYTSTVSSGISTLRPFHPSHRPTAIAVTTRLDTYLRTHGIDRVDFLKIDAEGHDLAVLESFPWELIRPRVVLCEFEDRKTTPLGHTYRQTADYLTARGYAVLVSEWNPIVEYGSAHTWRRVVDYPVDLAADAWGNLIGVQPGVARRARLTTRFYALRALVRRAIEVPFR
jgi:FkbM family methyltransferase